MKRGLIDFYSSLFANWISSGELISRDKLSSLGIKPLYDRIVTKKYIKKVICITRFPVAYDKRLLEVLNSIAFDCDKRSKVYLNTYSTQTKVNVTSDIFKRQMAESERRYQEYKEMYEGLSGTEKATGKRVPLGGGRYFHITEKQLLNLKEEYESYSYVHSVLSNRGELSNTFVFVEIISPDGKGMKLLRDEVVGYLQFEGFKFSELSANSSNYMSNYSPASFMREFTNKEFTDLLMSDENLTSLTPYKSHGFIGDGTGQLVAMDMGSKTPLILNFYKGGARQINLISAPSGHGKTIMAFGIAISLVASDIHVSALDVKGDEWEKLFPIVKGVKIDISESSKSYVNMLRLDDVEVTDREMAMEFYDTSVTATVELIKLITGYTQSEKIRRAEAITRQAINKVYSSNNVDKTNPKSFSFSRNLKYTDIISSLEVLKTSPSYKNDLNLIDDMRNLLEDKFRASDTFKGKEITVKDIIESKLVIYSLNRNKNGSSSLDDSIRTLFITYLDTKKISVRKQLRKGTACFYEELQRKDEFASLINFISGVVTGARSSNVSVFLLCNSIGIFNSKELEPIASNLSTKIIGPIENSSDYEVLEKLNCSELESKLRKFSENEERFKNYFAIKYNTGEEYGQAVIKSILPESVISKLRTRDSVI